MTKSDTVDLAFWGLIFFTITAIIGVFQCENWNSFLERVQLLGLFLDAIGALALVLSEFWPVQAFLWPGLVAAKNRIDSAEIGNNFDSHQPFLKQNEDGFQELATIARNRRELSNPQIEYSSVEIHNFCFWPQGGIYADGKNVNQVTIGPSEEVQIWISERITTLTRDKVYPYAAMTLFIGFSLQIISYGLRII
jgi:hypothetical protein